MRHSWRAATRCLIPLALQRLMPAAVAKGVDIVIGGPYSSGILAGGAHFEYAAPSKEVLSKVEQIKALCALYHVPIKAAALQFCLAHPAVAAVIPGASKPERIKEDLSALNVVIPADFRGSLRSRALVDLTAPLPIDEGS
jgi:D-threo-aldose 1-dehydrogenase